LSNKRGPILIILDEANPHTPMLREAFMAHGLEIVHVSYDEEVQAYTPRDVDATVHVLSLLKPEPPIKINRNRNCPRCRTPINWNAQYCSKCGAWAR
jgi:hypothetical protein